MDEGFVDDLVATPPAQLDEMLRSVELERRDAEARLALIAAVVEQRQQFLSDGHRSMSTYLKAHLNCSGAEANRIRRRGKLLDEHSCARRAVGAGHLAMSNVDLLAKAVAHPRMAERVRGFVPVLVEHGEHFPVKEYQVLVNRVISNADPDGADPSDDHAACATVAAGPGGVHIRVAGGTALQAAEMKAIFDLAVQNEFDADVAARRVEHGDAADRHPLPRTAGQRRFAAQYAIHMAYVTVPADGQRPEPIVDILFSAGQAGRALRDHALTTDDDVFDGSEAGLAVDDPGDLLSGRCETSTGVPISDHDALRSMIRGQVRRAVIDSAGVIVDLGRRRRLFTGAAREAARLVALTCVHPGCSVPAEFCDVDHLRRHANSGPTSQHNGAPECGSHNRFKERARLRSRRAANGRIYLIRPDDTVILPAGERRPDWPDRESTGREPVRPPDRSPPETPVFETISWAEYVANVRPVVSPDTWLVVRLGVDELPTRSGRWTAATGVDSEGPE